MHQRPRLQLRLLLFAKADTAQRYFHRAAKLDARSVRAAPAWRDPPVEFGVIRFTEILQWNPVHTTAESGRWCVPSHRTQCRAFIS